jgi:hypothetical protein
MQTEVNLVHQELHNHARLLLDVVEGDKAKKTAI